MPTNEPSRISLARSYKSAFSISSVESSKDRFLQQQQNRTSSLQLYYKDLRAQLSIQRLY